MDNPTAFSGPLLPKYYTQSLQSMNKSITKTWKCSTIKFRTSQRKRAPNNLSRVAHLPYSCPEHNYPPQSYSINLESAKISTKAPDSGDHLSSLTFLPMNKTQTEPNTLSPSLTQILFRTLKAVGFNNLNPKRPTLWMNGNLIGLVIQDFSSLIRTSRW